MQLGLRTHEGTMQLFPITLKDLRGLGQLHREAQLILDEVVSTASIHQHNYGLLRNLAHHAKSFRHQVVQ